MKKDVLHIIAMWVILIGSLALFYIAFKWYSEKNFFMGSGMMIMGLIALSNFYLHWKRMVHQKRR